MILNRVLKQLVTFWRSPRLMAGCCSTEHERGYGRRLKIMRRRGDAELPGSHRESERLPRSRITLTAAPRGTFASLHVSALPPLSAATACRDDRTWENARA